VHHINSQDTLPEIGQTIAYTANRDGVAERGADPAVQKPLAVDLARIPSDAELLQERARSILQTAQPQDAQTLYLLHTGPGIGKRLRLVRLYASHDMARFASGQDFGASCRLVKCAQDSAGQRWGMSGTKIGPVHRQGACAAAATLFLRNNAAAQSELAR
jgi:transposase